MKILNKVGTTFLRNLIPIKARPMCKRFFASINLYDERLARFGLRRIYGDDTFIVSYPRSGNTWVRFLIANLMHPETNITFRNIEQYIPDIHKSRSAINVMKRPRFIKTHWPIYVSFPRFIYIFRDGRDAVLSYYYYEKEYGRFKDTLTEFLCSQNAGTFGYWHEHVSKAFDFSLRNPNRVLLLQYEQMLMSPLKCAYKISKFCRFSCSKKILENAVNRCSFEMLQKNEKEYGSEDENINVRFFRKGKTGQWKDVFSNTDLQIFLSIAGNTLHKLGYTE